MIKMVEAIRPAVVFMFIDSDQNVLEELRPANSQYPEEWICPGGRIEPDESALDALLREVREELGVKLIKFEPLPTQPIYSPGGRFIHPFIIFGWDGVIPSEVLDNKHPLRWNPLTETSRSNIESVRKLALAAMDYLEKHGTD